MNRPPTSARSDRWGWLAAGLAAATFVADVFLPDGTRFWPAVVGILVLVVAMPLMFMPFHYLKRYGGVPARRAYWETTAVVERGPYALVRHPQYLGYSLLVVGFALTSQHLVTGATAAAAALCFYRQAVAEEAHCRRALGPAYDAYAARVPRFDVAEGLRRWWRKRPHR